MVMVTIWCFWEHAKFTMRDNAYRAPISLDAVDVDIFHVICKPR